MLEVAEYTQLDGRAKVEHSVSCIEPYSSSDCIYISYSEVHTDSPFIGASYSYCVVSCLSKRGDFQYLKICKV